MKTRFVCIGGLLVLGLWLAPQPAGAAPRYWVGNGGAWSDTNHWATSSGGAGSNSVPGASDDVYFDANSAGSATVDVSFAGTVLSLTLSNGYTGTNTQVRNLTVVNDCLIGGGAWQFTNGANASLTVNGNMVVSNATVYCQRASTVGEGTGRVFTVGGSLTVATNGSFNADGLGFNPQSGPGVGGNYLGFGASHGGRGAAYLTGSSFKRPANTYGSVTAPTSLGSGASDNGSADTRCPGGGAIRLIVGGTLTLQGLIDAVAGSAAFTWNAGAGGAGGSIWITASNIVGNGTINANGTGGSNAGSVAGGGGRIAVYTSNSFGNVTMQAYGQGLGVCGGAGTIYLQDGTQAAGQGTLIINNGKLSATPGSVTMIPIGQTWTFPTVILTNAGVLGVVSNTYSLAGVNLQTGYTNLNQAGQILVDYGTLDVGQTFAFSNYVINLWHAANLTATNITVGSNAVLRIDGPNSATGDVTIAAGGVMDHTYWNGIDVEWFKIDLALTGNLTIQSGGSINLTGKGYGPVRGPGAGGGYHLAGASHGGRGSKYLTTESKTTYGSMVAPTNWGSGADDYSITSPGGGAARLNVSQTLTVNGKIEASGQQYAHQGGGGSGGSLWIVANDLEGSGLIAARGASSTWSDASGGGGGRVAVYSSGDFGSLAIGAEGNTGDDGCGAAGTVYLKGPNSAYGTLVIANSNLVTLADITTRIPTNNFTGAGTNLDVGSVVILNRGNLQVPTGMTLVVHGSWTNSARFTADTNSTIQFAVGGPVNVTGSNLFFNLISTNTGATLTFDAGKTNTVLGKITLANVTLNSTVNGQYTYLTLSTNGGSQQIGAVIVQDNNAGGGQQMLAGPRSANSGHNVNWKFPVSGTTFFFR